MWHACKGVNRRTHWILIFLQGTNCTNNLVTIKKLLTKIQNDFKLILNVWVSSPTGHKSKSILNKFVNIAFIATCIILSKPKSILIIYCLRHHTIFRPVFFVFERARAPRHCKFLLQSILRAPRQWPGGMEAIASVALPLWSIRPAYYYRYLWWYQSASTNMYPFLLRSFQLYDNQKYNPQYTRLTTALVIWIVRHNASLSIDLH